MERRSFTGEFKREAVKLATQAGVSKAKVAAELGIHATVLNRWVREAKAGKWTVLALEPQDHAALRGGMHDGLLRAR